MKRVSESPYRFTLERREYFYAANAKLLSMGRVNGEIFDDTHTLLFIRQFLVIVKTNDPIFLLSIKPIKR